MSKCKWDFYLESIGLDEAFHILQMGGVDIFTFNETQDDDVNSKSQMVSHRSKWCILQQNNGFSFLQTSSCQALVTGFIKPGGNMIEIMGNLVGQIRTSIDDSYRN